MPEELAALFCYVPLCGVGVGFSALVLVRSHGRRWLRSHAWQGIVLGLLPLVLVTVSWLGDFVLEASGLPTPGLALVAAQIAAAAACLVAALRAMAGAYRRRDAALPWIGARARRWSGLA
jgi:hypothetical protein